MSEELSEEEEIIVNCMSDRVGKGIERLEANAKEMLKFITTILTILTGLATFFSINIIFLVLPFISLFIGLLGFILVLQPTKINYKVGEVDSCTREYKILLQKKGLYIKIAYIACYIGLIYFAVVLIA